MGFRTRSTRTAVWVALAFAAGLGCRHPAAPEAVDPVMASCVPPNATLLAGIDLGRLRAAPLYSKLPIAGLLDAQPLAGARYALVVWIGQDLLVIARGAFRQAPAGTTLSNPDSRFQAVPIPCARPPRSIVPGTPAYRI